MRRVLAVLAVCVGMGCGGDEEMAPHDAHAPVDDLTTLSGRPLLYITIDPARISVITEWSGSCTRTFTDQCEAISCPDVDFDMASSSAPLMGTLTFSERQGTSGTFTTTSSVNLMLLLDSEQAPIDDLDREQGLVYQIVATGGTLPAFTKAVSEPSVAAAVAPSFPNQTLSRSSDLVVAYEPTSVGGPFVEVSTPSTNGAAPRNMVRCFGATGATQVVVPSAMLLQFAKEQALVAIGTAGVTAFSAGEVDVVIAATLLTPQLDGGASDVVVTLD